MPAPCAHQPRGDAPAAVTAPAAVAGAHQPRGDAPAAVTAPAAVLAGDPRDQRMAASSADTMMVDDAAVASCSPAASSTSPVVQAAARDSEDEGELQCSSAVARERPKVTPRADSNSPRERAPGSGGAAPLPLTSQPKRTRHEVVGDGGGAEVAVNAFDRGMARQRARDEAAAKAAADKGEPAPVGYTVRYWAEEDAFNQRKNAAVARAYANYEARMRR